ncbi:hypothetical protein HZU77_003475 [Neisseriaceae bacterium TC5R-5]|nr:hypothetical protein [Neisseriaceae bacterium TC5R-5]
MSVFELKANYQCHKMQQELRQYWQILPSHSCPRFPGELCRADAWQLGQYTLNQDLAMEPEFAHTVLQQLSSQRLSQSLPLWLYDFLYGGASGEIRSTDRLSREIQSVLFGASSLPGNVNSVMLSAHEANTQKTQAAILAARRKMEAGFNKSIKINSHITIYNANTSGKGRPRPRMRISGLPIQTVTPGLTPNSNYRSNAYGGGSIALGRGSDTQKLARISSRFNGLYINRGGAAIGFAVSGALDLADSINRDTQGKLNFDARRFSILSARSQSGNVVGAISGAAVGLLVAPFSVSAAALVVIGFGAGFVAQVIWGWTGGTDLAEKTAKKLLED